MWVWKKCTSCSSQIVKNNITINEFYDTLYEKASKDVCSNSYADFTYTNIDHKNDLYVELLPYNDKNIDANSNSKLISDFNLKYAGKVTIKEIRNIKISDVLIKTSPRGCSPTGYYNISFTVSYINHLV